MKTATLIRAGVLTLAIIALPAAAADLTKSTRAPTLVLTRASVTATGLREGYAGKALIRVRFCAEIGPRAVLLMRETRKIGGLTKASDQSVEPLGVDLERVLPYECVQDFEVEWLVRADLLVGGGTYYVSVRLRDGRGRVTRPVGFSFHSRSSG